MSENRLDNIRHEIRRIYNLLFARPSRSESGHQRRIEGISSARGLEMRKKTVSEDIDIEDLFTVLEIVNRLNKKLKMNR